MYVYCADVLTDRIVGSCPFVRPFCTGSQLKIKNKMRKNAKIEGNVPQDMSNRCAIFQLTSR